MNNNFLYLLKILNANEVKSLTFQTVKRYADLVHFVLFVMKNFPQAFNKINISDSTLSQLLETIENYMKSLKKTKKNRYKILQSTIYHQANLTLFELLLIAIFFLGVKRITSLEMPSITHESLRGILSNEFDRNIISNNKTVTFRRCDLVPFLFNENKENRYLKSDIKKRKLK